MSASLLGRLGREGMGLRANPSRDPRAPSHSNSPTPPSGATSPLPSCPHTLTSWQKCPMPRILKEPAGCTFSHLRKTVVPATWDSAQLSSRGVTVWKCLPSAHSAGELSIPQQPGGPVETRATAQAAPVRGPLTRPGEEGRGRVETPSAWFSQPPVCLAANL